MDTNTLESIRDHWVEAFFNGDYAALAQYEDQDFKVIYEQEGRVESHYTRYTQIEHAVQNGVWKPQKLDVEAELFDFDENLQHCQVQVELSNQQKIQENWVYTTEWKITELRFLK
ncbi:hypothetical protein [Acinetobacter sp.]|uniref:hypothetical protein n=1 Tax=Acinetobacter sp. TaxID=472 RepID=UPI00388FB112